MLVLALLSSVLTLDAKMLTPGDHVRTLEFESRSRTYLVHVPKQYDPSRATPVVLAFHGGGTNGQSLVRFCGLNETSDEAGFIAVYPNGTGRNELALTWNAGSCCAYAMQQNVNDVGFVRALLDDLQHVANVDPKRVFATGMSNGGMMAYREASELSDRIAAIAPGLRMNLPRTKEAAAARVSPARNSGRPNFPSAAGSRRTAAPNAAVKRSCPTATRTARA